jgi:hypothetical protein
MKQQSSAQSLTMIRLGIRLLLMLMLAGGLPGVVVGQGADTSGTVIPREQREQVLQRSARSLDKQAPADLTAIEPLLGVVAALQPKTEGADAAEAVVVEATRPADDEILKRIAQQFKPRGALILGSVSALRMADGSLMRTGDKFTAVVSNDSYEVQLTAVTTSSYTLQLGTASLTLSTRP